MRHVSCSKWHSWQATRPKKLTVVSENRMRESVVVVEAGVVAVAVVAVAVVGTVEVVVAIVHGVFAVVVAASASVVRAVAFRG